MCTQFFSFACCMAHGIEKGNKDEEIEIRCNCSPSKPDVIGSALPDQAGLRCINATIDAPHRQHGRAQQLPDQAGEVMEPRPSKADAFRLIMKLEVHMRNRRIDLMTHTFWRIVEALRDSEVQNDKVSIRFIKALKQEVMNEQSGVGPTAVALLGFLERTSPQMLKDLPKQARRALQECFKQKDTFGEPTRRALYEQLGIATRGSTKLMVPHAHASLSDDGTEIQKIVLTCETQDSFEGKVQVGMGFTVTSPSRPSGRPADGFVIKVDKQQKRCVLVCYADEDTLQYFVACPRQAELTSTVNSWQQRDAHNSLLKSHEDAPDSEERQAIEEAFRKGGNGPIAAHELLENVKEIVSDQIKGRVGAGTTKTVKGIGRFGYDSLNRIVKNSKKYLPSEGKNWIIPGGHRPPSFHENKIQDVSM